SISSHYVWIDMWPTTKQEGEEIIEGMSLSLHPGPNRDTCGAKAPVPKEQWFDVRLTLAYRGMESIGIDFEAAGKQSVTDINVGGRYRLDLCDALYFGGEMSSRIGDHSFLAGRLAE